MIRRIAILTLVLAALLLLAAPAFAFNGYRADYTTSDACAVCHTSGQPASAPKVFDAWAATAHGQDPEAASAAQGLPYGSVCVGCHTANYDPSKVTPVPTATSTSGSVSWGASPSTAPLPQSVGNAPFSETDIGCSSCHYGADVNGVISDAGSDVNDTAHNAPFQQLANADICGACHTRYAYTVGTYAVLPVPTPTASQTTLIQPQMALGYPMLNATPLGQPSPLSSYLNIPSPGWTPTPNPTATSAAGLQIYWQLAGASTVWQSKGHEGSSAQYSEWLSERHARALTDLKLAIPNPPASCLQCHSADYRIAPANAKPSGTQAKYGITCVGCHTPHPSADQNTTKGVWDDAFDSQLVGNPKNPSDLCTTCHTNNTGDGVFAAGATIYEDQREDMNGTGAIGVPQGFPGVHKGKCVQCHMPPTSFGQGVPQLGGNHTFKIITPQDSVDVTPVAVSGVNQVMPYSACSTCHNKPGDDNAVWLQDTIDQRQAAMQAKYAAVETALVNAGHRLGYQQPASDTSPYTSWLNTTLNTKGSAAWTPGELLWQKGYTDWTYIAAESSWGIHNWQYDTQVIEAALNFANLVTATIPQTVTFKISPTSIKANTVVTYSGTVSPATTTSVQIMRKASNGTYNPWKAAAQKSGKFSIKVNMTAKGTFYFKAFLAAKAPYKGGTSAIVKLVVK